ncbi:MBL fold metallo-hydrolase [Gemmatimonadota bacterium]
MKVLALAGVLFVAIPVFLGPSSAKSQARAQDEITVTVLFDNLWTDDRLQTGWGFAALLETPGHTVLFDTGADGEILLENMRLMDKDPARIEAVIISHAHGDHTGGMQALFDLGIRPRLYLLPGFPQEMRDQAAESVEMIEAAPGQEIIPGVISTGQVGESIPEQALILETAEGLVVLTGCAHPGVVQMVERARELRSGTLHQVMGGFHLMNATGQEIQGVVEEFRRLQVKRAGPTHCSGLMAMTVFQSAYGEDFVRLGVGRVLRFPLPATP